MSPCRNLALVVGLLSFVCLWNANFPCPRSGDVNAWSQALFYSNLASILVGFQSDYLSLFSRSRKPSDDRMVKDSAKLFFDEIDTADAGWRKEFDEKWTARSPETRQPIILRKIVQNSGFFSEMRTWDLNYFKNIFGNSSVAVATNYTSYKALVRMPFDLFLRKINDGSEGLYMRCQSDASRKTESAVPYEFYGEIAGKQREMNLSRSISNVPLACFFVGNVGSFTPLHSDIATSFFLQIQGRKRWYYYPPSETMIFSPMPLMWNSAYRPRSFDDFVPQDTARPPHAGAAGSSSINGPGDLLVLPSLWWHSAENLDNTTIAMTVATLDVVGSFARNAMMAAGTFLNPNMLFRTINSLWFSGNGVKDTFLKQFFKDHADVAYVV